MIAFLLTQIAKVKAAIASATGDVTTLDGRVDDLEEQVANYGNTTLTSDSPVKFKFPTGYGIVLLVGMWQGHGGNIFAARIANDVLSVRSVYSATDYTGTNPAFSYDTTTKELTISQTAPSITHISYIQALH